MQQFCATVKVPSARMPLLARTLYLSRLISLSSTSASAATSTFRAGRTVFVQSPHSTIARTFLHHRSIVMSKGDVDSGGDFGGSNILRPRLPLSSITAFGQGLGQEELQRLSKELERSSDAEKLVSPFIGRVYDVAHAALFYTHNGRMDNARDQIKAGEELLLTELKGIDEACSTDGVRSERLSNCLEMFIKAQAFMHFLSTGRLLRRAELEGGHIEDTEYLGAVMRLTSELSRYAITQASELDRSSIRACASLCRALFGELVQFDFRNGPLRKKFDGVKYDVRKMDDILYELSLVDVAPGHDHSNGSRKRDREETEGEAKGQKVHDEGEAQGVLDNREFETIRQVMADFDEKREFVIKQTRDVQKGSKMAIYSLHRGDTKKADKQVADCLKAAEKLLPLITETPRLRLGAFSAAMEEFAEARLYQLWLKEKKLATVAEVGLVNTEEYLGGLLDLTGELNRFAVARATDRDSEGVKECLETILVIHEFVTLNSLPGRLPKKRGELNNSLRKLQNMTYELALMKAGKGKVAGVSGLDDEHPPSQGDVSADRT